MYSILYHQFLYVQIRSTRCWQTLNNVQHEINVKKITVDGKCLHLKLYKNRSRSFYFIILSTINAREVILCSYVFQKRAAVAKYFCHKCVKEPFNRVRDVKKTTTSIYLDLRARSSVKSHSVVANGFDNVKCSVAVHMVSFTNCKESS